MNSSHLHIFTKDSELKDGEKDQEVKCLPCNEGWNADPQNPYLKLNKTVYEGTHSNLGVEEMELGGCSAFAGQPAKPTWPAPSQREILSQK